MTSKASRIVLIAGGTVLLLAVIALAATLIFSGGDRICRGVTVSGVTVGGFTRDQARTKIELWATERAKRQVTLVALDVRFSGTYEDFGAKVDTQTVLDRAFSVGRKGPLVNRTACVLTPWGRGKHFNAEFRTGAPRLRKALARIASRVDRPHKDASLRVVSNRLEIRPEGCGIVLNKDKSIETVSRAVASGLVVISLPVEVDKPDVTAADAAGIDTLISRFTTSFNPGKIGRTHNLTLAARCLNGVVLKPNMEFSTNKTVGPRLQERGFRSAPIFVKGKLEEGLGGGVCQVSSTLYNAVLLAGLRVVERNHHSRTVPYVRPGRDATVAYGLLDFRFQNSNPSPIGIVTHVTRSQLTVDLYGSATDRKDIKVYSTVAKWVPVKTQTTIDASLPAGVRKTIEKGSRGVSVTVYRQLAGSDGKAITEVVSRDRYQPLNTVIAVGAARAQQQARAILNPTPVARPSDMPD